MQRWRNLAIGIGGGVAVVVLLLAIWFTIEGWWGVVVDIVLAFTALIGFVMLGVLTLAVIFLIRTILEIKAEVMPVLDSLKSTTSTVRETAKTAQAFGLAPAVRTASFVVGASEIAGTILGRGHARKRSDQRQKRRQQIERELAAEQTGGDYDGAR